MMRGMASKDIFESKSESKERGAIWQNITVSLKMTNTAQKMEFSIKDFLSKCDQIRRLLRITADLVTFTAEILDGKLHFLCSATS